LGSGAFGEIFLGVNTKTLTEVAIKIEKISSPIPQLLYEAEVYKKLFEGSDYSDQGIPHVYLTSTEKDYHYMVMDRLGKSLEDYFFLCKRKFSLKTVIMLGL
jgi:casein kinase 1